ncbi:MAG TPA: hypothetical protein VK447_07295, partial [Myxococcaceae bacterium]|nr:hypothetical protein [Myxococcaceae bacterium]
MALTTNRSTPSSQPTQRTRSEETAPSTRAQPPSAHAQDVQRLSSYLRGQSAQPSSEAARSPVGPAQPASSFERSNAVRSLQDPTQVVPAAATAQSPSGAGAASAPAAGAPSTQDLAAISPRQPPALQALMARQAALSQPSGGGGVAQGSSTPTPAADSFQMGDPMGFGGEAFAAGPNSPAEPPAPATDYSYMGDPGGFGVEAFAAGPNSPIEPSQAIGQRIQDVPESATDGLVLGGDGRLYSPETPIDQVPAFMPNNGAPTTSDDPIVHTNGILTDAFDHATALQDLANATGRPVLGLRNATHGAAMDLGECTTEKAGIASTPSESLARIISQRLQAGESVDLSAHSQGAIISSSALAQVTNDLRAQGMSSGEIEQALSNVSLTTFGGASQSYPNGPNYEHNLNRADYVSSPFGLGPFSIPTVSNIVPGMALASL